jgi:hypothetical protein
MASGRCVARTVTGIEHCELDVQFDQSGETVDGLLKVHRFGVEVGFFDFSVGSHHEVLAPGRVREHNIRCQLVDLNAGFVDQLRHIQYLRCFEHLGTGRWSSKSDGGDTAEKGKNQRVEIACTHNSSAMTAL